MSVPSITAMVMNQVCCSPLIGFAGFMVLLRRTLAGVGIAGQRAVVGIYDHLALMPARRLEMSPLSSMAMRTGMRCTTLTQLPVAFWAGSTENTEPVPGAMLSTVPCQV